MDYTKQRRPASASGASTLSEPLIAYVYGEAPPDFSAIAACGFTVVCLDSSASWFSDSTVADAKAHDLVAVPFRMSYTG
jgi:hypothetical protein